MCPSYQVTREELHSTRGRAHLLFEMLRGDALTDGWNDEHVKDALDLCLACKGCRHECPVSVDVATYKAEFLAHYYEKHSRPRSAYAMGLIHRWARLASLAPRLANAVAQAPGLTSIVKKLGGISVKRQIPRFAPRTFVDWFRARRPAAPSPSMGTKLLLWPDTFTNHFHPEIAVAAVEVLEAGGFDVSIPERSMCCGRPLYDYGFLTQAKELLRDVMAGLAPAIRAQTPIVVLEPSCLAVFRDELVNLFPNDDAARRLSRQTFLLSEFLAANGTHAVPTHLHGRVMLHGHCHHKAVAKLDDEEALLRACGADVETIDSGCCGMAGSFGFEEEHYELSLQVGELSLLPAVRRASPDTVIVANGFSCREQIRQATGRNAVHLAEALRSGLSGT